MSEPAATTLVLPNAPKLPRPGFALAARLGAMAAIAAVLAMGWLLHQEMQQTRRAAGWVQHTQQVLETIDEVRQHLAQIESAQRGWLLSQSPPFVEERDAAIARLGLALAQLEALTVDSPSQQERVRELEQRTERRIAMALASTLGPRAQLPQAIRAAHEATTGIYALAQAMEARELHLLAERQQRHEAQQRQSVLVLSVLVLGSVGLLLPGYLYAWRQRGLRRRVERRMADLVERLPVAVWQARTAPSGQRGFVYVAPGSQSVVGLLPSEVLGDIDSVARRVLPEDRPALLESARRAEQSLADFEHTVRVRLPAEGLRWLHSRATLRRERDGGIVWNGYSHDITREVMLERQLRQLNAELEAFSYSVSHDLRAPLASIDGFSQALAERAGGALDDKARHYLARIRAATRTASELIEGLLTLAQASRQELQRGRVDLSAQAEEILAALREQDSGREVQVEVQPGLLASGDARMLRQVLANLLGNAWKFSAPRAPARIRVGRVAEGEDAGAFFVEDNGVGFDMAHAERLFAAFQRLHGAGEFPGTGIGLATAMRIVSRHDGRLWVRAAPHQGATFFFTTGPAHD